MSIPGSFLYKDICILQNENIGTPFKDLINSCKPARILEIGTASGGLCLLLRDILDAVGLTNTSLKTYDISDGSWQRSKIFLNLIKDRNIESILQNIFNESYTTIIDNSCIDFIQQTGTTIVLCDGGNKPKEFNLLSKYLKPGDIILAHDYARSYNYFIDNIKDIYWNYCEITDDDIKVATQENSLQDFLKEDFEKVAWCCKIKI